MRVRCVKTALTEDEVGFEGLARANKHRLQSKSADGPRHTLCDVGFESTVFAIPEWINEPMFLENLVDGYERELAIMRAAVERMENEFDVVEETA